jgi:hypothetical protein
MFVAASWSVRDSLATSLARLMYGAACDNGKFHPERIPAAFHAAVRELRITADRDDVEWATFVHIGP